MAVCIFMRIVPGLVPAHLFGHKVNTGCAGGGFAYKVAHKDAQGVHKVAQKATGPSVCTRSTGACAGPRGAQGCTRFRL